MTERFSQKDLERAAKDLIGLDDGEIDGVPSTGKHYCKLCANLYVHQKTAVNHIIESHLNDVMKKAEDIERELDEKMQKWEEERAMKAGSDYFEAIEYNLKHMLREVQRYKKGFEKARDQEAYENGYMPPRKNMVDEINACLYHVSNNFNHDVSKGARAIGQLAKAFNFDL